jgi:hypothetical protein
MQPEHEVLNKSEWERAHRAISAWKSDPDAALACPRCEAAGLELEDRSARPYAEWFHLKCGACGLEVSMHLPQAPASHTPS